MTTKNTGVELVPYSDYAIATMDSGELAEILAENVGDTITPLDLPRAKVPTGGMTAWALPSLDGPDEITANIDGVIVYHRKPRAFWRASLDESGGGAPPDCSSDDGKRGIGDPGGDCKTCPMAQWGSKPSKDGESRGQWCKQMKLVFVLRPNALLPTAMFLPPTSIAPVEKYMLGLTSEGQHYSSVQTRFTLEKERSESGIEYAKVKLTRLGVLERDQYQAVREYGRALRGTLDTVTITADDVMEYDADGNPVTY